MRNNTIMHLAIIFIIYGLTGLMLELWKVGINELYRTVRSLDVLFFL